MPDANNVSNVTASAPALNGAISVAPAGTTPPTSISAALTGFETLGYISEDGVTNSNSPSSTAIKAWGGDTVLVTDDGRTNTYKFKAIEYLKPTVLKMTFGDTNVSGDLTNGITVNGNNKPMEEHVWVIDIIHRDGVLERIVIPKGTVTAIGDIVYKSTEATASELTVSAFPDSSGNSDYRYIKAPAST